jgi:ketopantoate reductase
LNDLRSGRTKSEIDELNGAIVRAGKTAGVPAPVNDVLANTMQDLVTGRVDRVAWRRQIDRLVELTGV